MSAQITLGSFFDKYAPGYIHSHRLSSQEKGILRLLSMCRSSGLGAHKELCPNCGYEQISYNSCRNRHCPTLPTAACLLQVGQAVSGLISKSGLKNAWKNS